MSGETIDEGIKAGMVAYVEELSKEAGGGVGQLVDHVEENNLSRSGFMDAYEVWYEVNGTPFDGRTSRDVVEGNVAQYLTQLDNHSMKLNWQREGAVSEGRWEQVWSDAADMLSDL